MYSSYTCTCMFMSLSIYMYTRLKTRKHKMLKILSFRTIISLCRDVKRLLSHKREVRNLSNEITTNVLVCKYINSAWYNIQ